MSEFVELESRLGYQFKNLDLLRVALTHRSFHFENKKVSLGHFERYEFLGDAALDLVLSELLMNRFAAVDEGTLSKWRASLVNETTLSDLARELELGRHLYLGKSEQSERERARPRLLASALEAVMAAIYLDGGLPALAAFVERIFAERLTTLSDDKQFATDFKTRLQEYTQKRLHLVPEYRLLEASGPEHDKHFRYEVLIEQRPWGEGEGNSRKSAEQEAARQALAKIENQEEVSP